MKSLIILFIVFAPLISFAQQIADTTYNPNISNPAYELGEGPTVFIDAGHNNFHTKNGRYWAFANLLQKDGYNVKELKGTFRKKKLDKGKVLVISNAVNEINLQNWVLPNPSAFTSEEIEAVKNWVFAGGRLFLIADHMPMAGAAADLAAVFDFEFTNGFVFDTISKGPSIFSIEENTLTESVISKGRDSNENVKQIATFTGQAFKIPDEATPILTFSKNHVNLLPDTAWVFNEKTTLFDAEGWSQGAYREYGKGKVVVFGEAAMFTAQLAGPQQRKMGMNNEIAPENYQLLLNIIHWLDDKLE
ncbi:MAG: DUF4350 domain-containing protein [Bacteroidota bacterium]